MKKTLKFMPYAQAHVILEHGDITLISYKTPVATITSDFEFMIAGLYSRTTRRHIKAFIKEYIPFEMDSESIKYLAKNPVKLDLTTGEVLDI